MVPPHRQLPPVDTPLRIRRATRRVGHLCRVLTHPQMFVITIRAYLKNNEIKLMCLWTMVTMHWWITRSLLTQWLSLCSNQRAVTLAVLGMTIRQTTANHRKPPRTTTNHHKPPQITTRIDLLLSNLQCTLYFLSSARTGTWPLTSYSYRPGPWPHKGKERDDR